MVSAIKKILVTDFDGTLYQTREQLIETIPALEKFMASGNLFVIATGRSLFSLKQVLADIKIPFSYLILYNGAVILDNKYQILQDIKLSKASLIAITKHYENWPVTIEFAGIDRESTDYHLLKKIYKMKIKATDESITMAIQTDLLKNYGKKINAYIIPVEEGGLVDIITKKCDKATAISYLLNIHRDLEVHVIGDSENDLKMIEMFKGYAVNNAKKEVLTASTASFDSVLSLIDFLK